MSIASGVTPESVLEEWGGDHVATAAFGPDGVIELWGDAHRVVRIASISKLVTGYAALIALEEGAIELEEPAGPPGATVHDLFSHSSGWAFEWPTSSLRNTWYVPGRGVPRRPLTANMATT